MRVLKIFGAAAILGAATLAAQAYNDVVIYGGESYTPAPSSAACVEVSTSYDPCNDVFFVLNTPNLTANAGYNQGAHAPAAVPADDFAIPLYDAPAAVAYEPAAADPYQAASYADSLVVSLDAPAAETYVATASYVMAAVQVAAPADTAYGYERPNPDAYIGRINGPDYAVDLNAAYQEAPSAMAVPTYQPAAVQPVAVVRPEPAALDIVYHPREPSRVVGVYEIAHETPEDAAVAAMEAAYEVELSAPSAAPAPPAEAYVIMQKGGSVSGAAETTAASAATEYAPAAPSEYQPQYQPPAYITPGHVLEDAGAPAGFDAEPHGDTGPDYAPDGFAPNGWYVQGALGGSRVNNLKGDRRGGGTETYRTDRTPGTAGSIAVGRTLTQFHGVGPADEVRGRLDYTYASNGLSNRLTQGAGAANGQRSVNGGVMLNGVFASVEYAPDFQNRYVRPYVGAGVGYASVDVGGGHSAQQSAAFKAIAGVSTQYTDNIEGFLEYNFIHTPDVSLRRAGGGFEHANFKGHLLLAGLRYRF